jgi:hypothetical protein
MSKTNFADERINFGGKINFDVEVWRLWRLGLWIQRWRMFKGVEE